MEGKRTQCAFVHGRRIVFKVNTGVYSPKALCIRGPYVQQHLVRRFGSVHRIHTSARDRGEVCTYGKKMGSLFVIF